MTTNHAPDHHIAEVMAIISKLTDKQLAELIITVMQDFDPCRHSFFPIVKPLFALDDGTRMHETTKDALYAVFDTRL